MARCRIGSISSLSTGNFCYKTSSILTVTFIPHISTAPHHFTQRKFSSISIPTVRKTPRHTFQGMRNLKVLCINISWARGVMLLLFYNRHFDTRQWFGAAVLQACDPQYEELYTAEELSNHQFRSGKESQWEFRCIATPAEAVAGFDEMASGMQRKYFMLGGKGGVGKTSCAAALAVRFATHGHPTIVVSTDPAHSLSDSFGQDLSGGMLVPVDGLESPLFALEINPEKAREEFRTSSQKNGGTGLKDFMGSMGLGMLIEQLGELKLGELLDTPPPGLDEAIAISKVMQFVESPEYNMFTRVVFDTAPTGHTLRLLSLPDFLDASIGKILMLKKKLASAASAIKSVFGQDHPQQDASDKLEKLRERMVKVRELFRDADSTEFVVVTIPSVMAVSESSRLFASLKKESVPVRRLIVNQVLPPSSSDCKFCAMKRKDQMRALHMIQNDPELASLKLIQAPLVDVEIRGVPALKFMGEMVWK